jgi:hypothetical protein
MGKARDVSGAFGRSLERFVDYLFECICRSFVSWGEGDIVNSIFYLLAAAAPGLIGAWQADWQSGALVFFVVLIFVVTPFRIWRDNQAHIQHLDYLTKPKLRIEFKDEYSVITAISSPPPSVFFGSSAPMMVGTNTSTATGQAVTSVYTDVSSGANAPTLISGAEQKRGRYFYVKITAIGDAPVPGCNALLGQVEKWNGQEWCPTQIVPPQFLKWGGDESPEAFFPRTIPPGDDGFPADVFFIKSTGQVRLTTKTVLSNNLAAFEEHGVFRFKVSAISNVVGPPPTLYLVLIWNGDWLSAKVCTEDKWRLGSI